MDYNRLVAPEPNKLITFPAYLKHSVRPFAGKGHRISISFNLDVQSAFPAEHGNGKIMCINCNWGGAGDGVDDGPQAPGGMRVRPITGVDRPSMMKL